MIPNDSPKNQLMQLADIPNDGDLATIYQYTPVAAGWTPQGFNDAASTAAAATVTTDPDYLASVLALQQRQVTLQLISTVAIVTIATTAIISAIFGFRDGMKKRYEESGAETATS